MNASNLPWFRSPPPESGVPWFSSLRTQLMLWFSAVLAALLLGGFFSVYFGARQQVIESAERGLRHDVQQTVGAMQAAMGSVRIAGESMIELVRRAPILRHADGCVEMLELQAGPALGFDPSDAFPIWRSRLAPGDTLIGYTDGVTEAFDIDNHAFGELRLRDVLADAADADAACDLLARAVREFAGEAPQSDDITVFSLHCAVAEAAA